MTKIYTEPPICEKEILRYAGCKNSLTESLQFSVENLECLLQECLDEALPRLSYKVCYMELPLSCTEDICDFGCMKIESRDLAKNLKGCEKVILFSATIGVEIDRLIARYGYISPAKAVVFQAIGAERIEALCDMFCQSILCGGNVGASASLPERRLRPRFSPGYGDLPIEVQKDIFQVLNCSKNIGLSLNDSMLMSPSKSVTAFVGIGAGVSKNETNKCAACEKTDCEYRGI